MHVLAVTGELGEGLRHETRLETVLAGHTFDRPFQQHRLVACIQRVGAVMQVDLELAGRVLADRRLGVQVLRRTDGLHGAHETVEIMQLVQPVDLGGYRAPAAVGCGGRAWPALAVRPAVQKIELQLERDHRGQAAFLERRIGAGQHVAGVREVGRAVRLVQ